MQLKHLKTAFPQKKSEHFFERLDKAIIILGELKTILTQ